MEEGDNALTQEISDDKITKLDSWSVHRICSGQVIVCLAVAVKELVENALDASASEIIIRTKEYGSKLIEVQDNGEGIPEENFDALCRKHYTSKLRKFAELENILTFGFRGEALSSLCALGDLVVTTKHKSNDVGNVLKFNAEGLLMESKPCARSTGTTVTVENIFTSLPVRHKQFVGNLRKEFAKMVHFISGYCLIARDVAISLVNFDQRGKRQDVLKKRAHSSYKDNIVEIFGYKESTKLLPYAQAPIDAQVKEEHGLVNVSNEHFEQVSVEGYVSNCEHGSGRGSADRQFVFVNSRPCDFSKLTREINAVYHQFNSTQYPFVMLNIVTPQRLVDVNLTPDKRLLLLQRENVIIALIKASLRDMFQKQASKYTLNSLSNFSAFSRESSEPLELEGDSPGKSAAERRSRHAGPCEKKKKLDELTILNAKIEPVKPNLRERFSFKNESNHSSASVKRTSSDFGGVEKSKARLTSDPPTLSSFGFTRQLGKKPRCGPAAQEEKPSNDRCGLTKTPQTTVVDKEIEGKENALSLRLELVEEDSDKSSEHNSPQTRKSPGPLYISKQQLDDKSASDSVTSDSSSGVDQPEPNVSSDEKSLTSDAEEDQPTVPAKWSAPSGNLEEDFEPKRKKKEEIDEFDESSQESTKKKKRNEDELDGSVLFVDEVLQRQVGVHFLEWSEEKMQQDFVLLENETGPPTEASGVSRFRARISPKENNSAESELMREVTKDMFEKMEIVGQFNKGFIIAQLNDDLFIVDQHAADEKFNFETLQETTVIESQPLTVPLKLYLAPGNEQVVLEHLAIFEKNGFRLSYDEIAPCGRKFSLTAVPQSGQWAMGASEIDELVFMLNDNYHSNLMNCRPSKVRAMFAMRACRKSVMVGDELKHRDMRRVVRQLSGLQHPWNCPHGRPTMRHLVNLNRIYL